MPITLKKLSERTITIDDATFTVGPESYGDFAESLEFVRKYSLTGDVANYTASAYLIAMRILAWTGVVTPDGAEAACTKENRLALFGESPQLLDRIVSEYWRQETEDRKNSPPSQAG